jgi:GT2 family glycosyltransferase
MGVCVLTYNSEEVVAACIGALQKALAGVAHEIVVVDNSSSDRSTTLVEQCHPSVKILRSPTNGGYARGNNLGARQLLADGCRHLAFVNPDVTVQPDTLLQMWTVLDERRDAGCVGGVAAAEGRAFKGAFRTKPGIIEKLWLYSSMQYFPVMREWLKGVTASLESRHFLTLMTTQPVYAVSGACLMFSAEVFGRVGGFDENTFLYQEEFIISERLKSAGYKVYGCPEAIYEHHLGHSTHANFVRSKSFFIKSEQYYLRNYYKCGMAVRLLVKAFRWVDLTAWTMLAFLKRQLHSTVSNRHSASVS